MEKSVIPVPEPRMLTLEELLEKPVSTSSSDSIIPVENTFKAPLPPLWMVQSEMEPPINVEEYHGSSSDYSSPQDESESGTEEEAEFGSYDFKHDGLSESEEGESRVLTRQQIASDLARDAAKKHQRIELMREREEFRRPRGSFVKCPKGGSPPPNYFRRQKPGPFLYCPVSHMAHDSFEKLPYSTKPKPRFESFRRPCHLKIVKDRWYTDCRCCDGLCNDVYADADEYYQNYLHQMTFKEDRLRGKTWRDHLKEDEHSMETYGFKFPGPEKYGKPKTAAKSKKDENGNQTVAAKSRASNLKNFRLGSAKANANGRLGSSQATGDASAGPSDLKLAKKKNTVPNILNAQPVVPKHIFYKRKSQPKRNAPSVSRISTAIRPRYQPPAELEKQRSRSSIISSGGKERPKSVLSLVNIIERQLFKHALNVDTNDESELENESVDNSYVDQNAEFRKPDGEFDDDKYRKCVIEMLVKDLDEDVTKPNLKPKPKPKRKSGKISVSKKKSKCPYDHVKSRVDTKRPVAMRLKPALGPNSKCTPKKKKTRSGKKSGTLGGLEETKKIEFLNEIASELKKDKDNVSQYFAIPEDLKI